MTGQLGPDDPGAQDECATCGHARWRHRPVDGSRVCTEYVDCPCEGNFVELSQATRMARFVEAAQGVAGAMFTVRTAMTGAFRAFHSLHSAMQAAGLLPEEEPHLCDGCDSTEHPVTATDGRALLCPSCTRILKDQSIPLETNQPGGRHHVPRQELETAPRYAQQASDSCPTCWPYICDTTRSMCRRRPLDAEQTTQPPEPTDMETTQAIPPYHPGHRSDEEATLDGATD